MAFKRNNRGSIILGVEGNQFTLTKKEEKELNTLVKRANQRRNDRASSYYGHISEQKNMEAISYDGYFKLLNDKGFITEKYSASKNQFNSKEDIKDLLKELKTVTQKGYGDDRIDDVRTWMMSKIKQNYDGDVSLMDKVNNMGDAELLSIYLHNDDVIKEFWDSDDSYGEDAMEQRVNKLHSDLNLWTKGTKTVERTKKAQKKTFDKFKKQYYRNGMKKKKRK